MTEPGETDGLTLEGPVGVIREHVGLDLFDYVLVNDRPIEAAAIARYAAQGASPLRRESTASKLGQAQIIERSLAWQIGGGKIRHSPAALAEAILDLVRRRRPRHVMVPPRSCGGTAEVGSLTHA
jgi:2-phospho-L-lactate transferase/gluconeogenesis factor (CofD/UPF0052 family)